MASSQNNGNTSYGNLAERHHRQSTGRGVGATAVISGATKRAGQRRGLPDEQPREAEERAYQASYEQQLQERRQQRAAERRETRQREILSGRVEKRPPMKPLSEETTRWIKLALLALVVVACLVGSVLAYDRLTGSQLFVVKTIELQGIKQAPRDALLRVLEAHKSRSVWQLDLQAIRAAVEKNPWVKDAEVARVLPDALRVTVHEREPVAPWRTPASSVVWVDRDGHSLGELDLNQMEKVPPIISGLEEGTSNDIKLANQRRMELYQRLQNELTKGSTNLWEDIDEVRLHDLQSVRLHLTKHNVEVLLGGAEFRSRLEKAFKVLDAIERKDLSTLGFYKVTDAERLVRGNRIAYLNVTHAERGVVVGLAD